MNTRTIVGILSAVILLTSIHAAVVPGRWEKVEELEAGFPIVVRLTSGEQYKSEYIRLDNEFLTIKDHDDQEIRLRKDHVKSITSQARIATDSLWQGPVIGGAIGAALGIIPAAAISNEGNSDRAAAAVAVSAGIGAGIGLLVDAGTKAREVYYKAPSD